MRKMHGNDSRSAPGAAAAGTPGLRRSRPFSSAALRIAALGIAALWWMGMGGGNSSTEKVVPIPDKNYTVTVTDSRGAKVEARRFTWEGKVHFQGQFGQATVTLPFPKLQSMQIAPTAPTGSPNLILAKVKLKTGETLDLSLERTSKCYGETSFGTYEIFVRDIAQIQFE
jgi:hypothetical protein